MYTKSNLDIIGFNVINGDKHLHKISNQDFLEIVEKLKLTTEQRDLYQKLLKNERSRYVAHNHLLESVNEGYQERYTRYKQKNTELCITCVKELLEKYPQIKTKNIKSLVSNNTVGGMVPNITSSIANSLQIQNIRVIDLGYMGCATALLALELIEKELNAGEVGIVISAEITSVMMNLEAESNPSLVANSVFGDGIGAFLVAKKPHTYKAILSIKGHSASLITHDKALSCVTYDSNSIYHEINIHDTIPEVANEGIKAALPPIIKNHLATPYDKIKFVINKKIPEWQKNVDYAVLHTAGNKILHKLSENLKLKDKKVAHNFSAFNNYGNTSSASIYYALDYLYQENNVKPKQKFLFLAYGSGFFTRSCVMESI